MARKRAKSAGDEPDELSRAESEDEVSANARAHLDLLVRHHERVGKARLRTFGLTEAADPRDQRDLTAAERRHVESLCKMLNAARHLHEVADAKGAPAVSGALAMRQLLHFAEQVALGDVVAAERRVSRNRAQASRAARARAKKYVEPRTELVAAARARRDYIEKNGGRATASSVAREFVEGGTKLSFNRVRQIIAPAFK